MSYAALACHTETTYPSGLAVQYAYDRGRLSALNINGEPWITTIQHQPFGPVSGWSWADGSTYQTAYDLDGRLAQHPIGPEQREIHYDPAGNLIEQNDLLPDGQNRTRSYQYDLLGRLIDAQGDLLQQSWQYDANGNRLSQYDGGLQTDYAIDPASNRLLQIADDNLNDLYYDATGNLIEDAEHRYTYGPRNRLAAIDDGNQARYRHNALGQRVYKYGRLSGTGLIGDVNQDGFVDQHDIHLVNGLGGIAFDCDGPGQGDDHKNSDNKGNSAQNTPQGQTVACVATQIGDSKNQGKGNKQNNQGEIEITQTLLFAYDEQGGLIGEYEENGTPMQETLWLGGLPVATIREGVAYRVYPDHLGTPRAVADQSDTILWRWRSDPFGTTEADEDPDQDGQRFVYNLRFPGQYYDGETGRHYNYFRDYNPSTGRYVQSDPIGLGRGVNTYAYVAGNPNLYLDASGLAGLAPTWSPDYWDDPNRQKATNCYGYARNVPGSHWNTENQTYINIVLPPTCENLIKGAKQDGMIDPGGGGDCGGDCPDGYHKVQAFLSDDYWKPDFHWYRQDANSYWSHKMGSRRIDNMDASGKPIICPTNQDRNYAPYGGRNYAKPCGTLCAPN